MLFGGRSLQNHWQTAKKVIGDGWHGAVKLAGQLDQGMRVSRRLFGAMQPALDQFAGGAGSKHMMNAFTAYDSTKADVMSGYNQVEQMRNRIKRQVPELNL
jgi:hypothetical protein